MFGSWKIYVPLPSERGRRGVDVGARSKKQEARSKRARGTKAGMAAMRDWKEASRHLRKHGNDAKLFRHRRQVQFPEHWDRTNDDMQSRPYYPVL